MPEQQEGISRRALLKRTAAVGVSALAVAAGAKHFMDSGTNGTVEGQGVSPIQTRTATPELIAQPTVTQTPRIASESPTSVSTEAPEMSPTPIDVVYKAPPETGMPSPSPEATEVARGQINENELAELNKDILGDIDELEAAYAKAYEVFRAEYGGDSWETVTIDTNYFPYKQLGDPEAAARAIAALDNGEQLIPWVRDEASLRPEDKVDTQYIYDHSREVAVGPVANFAKNVLETMIHVDRQRVKGVELGYTQNSTEFPTRIVKWDLNDVISLNKDTKSIFSLIHEITHAAQPDFNITYGTPENPKQHLGVESGGLHRVHGFDKMWIDTFANNLDFFKRHFFDVGDETLGLLKGEFKDYGIGMRYGMSEFIADLTADAVVARNNGRVLYPDWPDEIKRAVGVTWNFLRYGNDSQPGVPIGDEELQRIREEIEDHHAEYKNIINSPATAVPSPTATSVPDEDLIEAENIKAVRAKHLLSIYGAIMDKETYGAEPGPGVYQEGKVEFMKELVKIADEIADHDKSLAYKLAAVIHFFSPGFRPDRSPDSDGQGGLLQLTEAQVNLVEGLSYEDMQSMSPVEQLKHVIKPYLEHFQKAGLKISSVEHLAMAILDPASIGKDGDTPILHKVSSRQKPFYDHVVSIFNAVGQKPKEDDVLTMEEIGSAIRINAQVLGELEKNLQ